jgi:hypothetical protein
VQLHTVAFYALAAEKMVIALVEGNDLAQVLGLRRPSPACPSRSFDYSSLLMTPFELKFC